ncbi:hypothetical protein DPX16_5977 [Anabarilius grahami]|uniref:Secreted protein n=1 Tax=Anabarilius grahami TaxID=495550 RepID=A0A3N0Z0X5_ANAGA|nr:hypothetical protein DPX16_5977 [Anabarilius grahami]
MMFMYVLMRAGFGLFSVALIAFVQRPAGASASRNPQEGERLCFTFCCPPRLSLFGPELLANSAKATGGEDVTCRSGMCVDVTSSPSPRSPRGKTPAGQTLLDNSSVGNTHFP